MNKRIYTAGLAFFIGLQGLYIPTLEAKIKKDPIEIEKKEKKISKKEAIALVFFAGIAIVVIAFAALAEKLDLTEKAKKETQDKQ